MTLLSLRVFNSLARRTFFLDHGVAIGPITTKAKKFGEIEEPESTHQEVNKKYDDLFGKTQTKRKKVIQRNYDRCETCNLDNVCTHCMKSCHDNHKISSNKGYFEEFLGHKSGFCRCW